MSDGSGSGGLSGTFEFVGQAAQQGAKSLAQGAGNMATTAVKQVAGTGGIGASPNMAGSFDLKGGASQSVDLFAPDAKQPAAKPQQMFGNAKPLTQAGQKALTDDRQYTQEEVEKIQSIEAELRSMHKQNNNIEADMEKVRREREEKYQQKLQDEAQKAQTNHMQELQQNGQAGQNIAAFQAARGTELAKGNQG